MGEALDFTDLIESALLDVDEAPGSTRFLFVDEAQDLSKLEVDLCRKWGKNAEKLILFGDPDQTIYEWRGASAENFTSLPFPEENYYLLDQSYRVPRAPHALAKKWIEQITERRDASYKPRDEDGQVDVSGVSYSRPSGVLGIIEDKMKTDQSVMLLASAAYMLAPTLKALRGSGIPFHNPFASKRGDWNPLRGKKESSDGRRNVSPHSSTQVG